MKKKRTQQKQEEEEQEQEQEIAHRAQKRMSEGGKEEDKETTISFIVKTSTNPKLEMKNIELTKLISELKADLATTLGSEKESIRLIYKGHVLKDEKTVKECSIGEGHAVHLVQSAPKKSPSLTSGGSSGRSPASHSEGGGGGQPTPPRTWMDDANASQRTAQAPDFATLFNSSVLGGGGIGGGGSKSGLNSLDNFKDSDEMKKAMKKLQSVVLNS